MLRRSPARPSVASVGSGRDASFGVYRGFRGAFFLATSLQSATVCMMRLSAVMCSESMSLLLRILLGVKGAPSHLVLALCLLLPVCQRTGLAVECSSRSLRSQRGIVTGLRRQVPNQYLAVAYFDQQLQLHHRH